MLTTLFLPAGAFIEPYLIPLAVSAIFVASGLLARAGIGRLPLVATWLARIVLIVPHPLAGPFEGRVIGAPMLAYLLA